MRNAISCRHCAGTHHDTRALRPPTKAGRSFNSTRCSSRFKIPHSKDNGKRVAAANSMALNFPVPLARFGQNYFDFFKPE
jgi:hypothetical protein